MAQYQFLNQRFKIYNAFLIQTLQVLANLLEAEKCYRQSELIQINISFLLEVEHKNAHSIAVIEENIRKSLLLD